MVGVEGCLDLTVTILIFLLNCCFNNLEKWNLWKIRIFIGLLLSIADFIVICAINNDNFLDDKVRKGLFGFIIVYIIIVYVVLIVYSFISISRCLVKVYKVCDIVLDAFLIAYTYVVAGEVNEPYEIVCVVIVTIDIILDFVSLFYGCRDVSIGWIEKKILVILLEKDKSCDEKDENNVSGSNIVSNQDQEEDHVISISFVNVVSDDALHASTVVIFPPMWHPYINTLLDSKHKYKRMIIENSLSIYFPLFDS